MESHSMQSFEIGFSTQNNFSKMYPDHSMIEVLPLLLLSSISQYECITVNLTIHLFKDSLVVSSF